MQDTQTFVGVIAKRGKKDLPIERLYRQLFREDLFLVAYGNIYGNQGATTPGSNPQNQVDGMSFERIRKIIARLRDGTFRWEPVRRVYIPKRNGRRRPLGLPNWDDKLVQETIRIILEAYYEPQFSAHSHGFRPGRGCHSALKEISNTFKGSAWFIEGDIRGCFDNIPHDQLIDVIQGKIHDERFIGLIQGLLDAGYLEDWKWNATYSGVPQGSILSPLLTNVFLNQLDRFIEDKLLPAYNRGKRRRDNREYQKLQYRASLAFKAGKNQEGLKWRKAMRTIPSIDPNDPHYRRLEYVRYADDFILGFAGTRSEAETIKSEIKAFLASMGLELSEEKTKITHARTHKAQFLGYDLQVMQSDTKQTVNVKGIKTRSVNGGIWFGIPHEVIQNWICKYSHRNKPTHRAELRFDSDYDVVARYQMEYRGLAQYYSWAYNRSTALGKLKWTMSRSLTGTLAAKHNTTRRNIVKKLTTRITVGNKVFVVLQVVVDRGPDKKPLKVHWGGISLARKPTVLIEDLRPFTLFQTRTELIQRLQADECEICGSHKDVEVHHIRALKDLKKRNGKEPPKHIQIMAARQRKTLVVCRDCHTKIHQGKL
jgi:group II intron reverse transcriptase/maturase